MEPKIINLKDGRKSNGKIVDEIFFLGIIMICPVTALSITILSYFLNKL